MTCIYTGAVVRFTDYSATLVCDLFQVGDVIFTNEGKGKFVYGPAIPVTTHTVTLGRDSYVHDTKFIAAPAAQWIGERR